MAIPEEIINEIKYRNDIESVIAPYVNTKRRGKNLVGLCPFHNEKTPSFTVYPESGSFYCFGCGVGGDVFTFTRLIENLDYIEAVKLLAERSGIALPQDGYDDSMQRLKNTIYSINRETAVFFHEFLMSREGKWALDYLTGRGLSIPVIKHFGLGAAPDSWNALLNHLRSKGFSDSDMLQANVVAKGQRDYYDCFRRRVVFPIINIRGNVVGFSGRAMPGDDKSRKYINTADTPVYKKSENLFAMNFAKNNCADRIILVEGNMDVVSLHQAGFVNTVAALGTSLTKEQISLIGRYTKEIVLMLDSDAAGQKAVERASSLLENSGLNVRVGIVPEGKDPDEYIKKHGAARFKNLIDNAISIIEYKLLLGAKDIDVNTDDGKFVYLNRAVAVIAQTDDVVQRDIYIGRLSEKYGVSRTALNQKVEELRKASRRTERKKEISGIIMPKHRSNDVNPERRKFPRGVAAEETLIAILMQHPDFYTVAAELLPEDKMLTTLNRRIYKKLMETLKSGRALDLSIFSEILTPLEIGYLVKLQNSEKAGNNAKIVLKDCIKVILEEGLLKNTAAGESLSDDEWLENLQKIIENKKKGN